VSAHRILIIEDDEGHRQSIALTLKMNGFEVKTARTGTAGLEIAETFLPDLVSLDLRLPPDMSGLEVCKRLRQSKNPSVSRVAILILSAEDSDRTRTEAFAAGADGYVTKPFEQRVWLAQIEALIRRALRAPFDPPVAKRAILGVTCSNGQPIHLTKGHGIEFLGITRGVLDLDPTAWGQQAQAVQGPNWRLLSKTLGENLWRKMFVEHREVDATYQSEMGTLGGPDKLRLRFPGTAEFLRVPLEYMHDQTDWLALRHPFARSVTGVKRNRPALCAEVLARIWAEQRPLRVLAIASNVTSVGLPAIPGADAEVETLERQLPVLFAGKGGRSFDVEVTAVPTKTASFAKVEGLLEAGNFDVLHYAGHCIVDQNTGQSALPFWQNEGATGSVKLLKAEKLRHLLEGSSATFVYLSGCEGAASAPGQVLTEYDLLGMADAIIQAGIPALLGFRWRVSDEAAVLAAAEFYRSLAEQGELDIAARHMRRSILDANINDPAWLSPILVVQR
jgi:DNA-binding response OmpR family regulator